eukprot:15299485-Alexandrium_andersonii.AAC.1
MHPVYLDQTHSPRLTSGGSGPYKLSSHSLVKASQWSGLLTPTQELAQTSPHTSGTIALNLKTLLARPSIMPSGSSICGSPQLSRKGPRLLIPRLGLILREEGTGLTTSPALWIGRPIP